MDTFLQQPLVLTGPWTRLFDRVKGDPNVALVVDECDVVTGRIQQVIARGAG